MAACALSGRSDQGFIFIFFYFLFFIFLEREKEISRLEQRRGNNRGIHLRSQTNEANF